MEEREGRRWGSAVVVKIIARPREQHRRALERMLFFHPEQGRFRRSLVDSVARLGTPRIVVERGCLRIELPGLPAAQSLYAVSPGPLRERLLGAVVFTRTCDEELEILHIVVRGDCTLAGTGGSDSVAFSLMDQLCRIARRINGVRRVRLAYGRGRVMVRSL